jgi:hypothetical protein
MLLMILARSGATAICALAIIVCFPAGANADDACIALVKQGIYNTNSSSESQQDFAQYKSNFCSWYSSYRATTASGGLGVEIPLADIPVGINANMTYGQADAQYQALCKSNEGSSADSNVYQAVSKYISPEAEAAYVDCIKAEKSGLSATANISDDDTLFTIDMAYIAPVGASPKATVLQVSLLPADEFTCPKPQNGGVDIRDLVGRRNDFENQDVGLSCIRKLHNPAISVNGLDEIAPSAELSIQTTIGTYTQQFRPIIKDDPIADTAKVMAALPEGTIIAWDSLVTRIPQGWHICDGTGGTPNLIHRFPVGAASDSELNSQAGQATTSVGVSGTTSTVGNGDLQHIDNSSNYLEALGSEATFPFHGQTDSINLMPPSTYIYYIMKM